MKHVKGGGRKKDVPVKVCGDLFFELPEEERNKLLQEADYKLKNPQILEFKLERMRREAERKKPRFRRLDVASWSMGGDCPGFGFLADGWWRLFALNKQGGIEIYRGERYKQEWLAHQSKAVLGQLSLKEWPNIKTSSNPWRHTWFCEAHVLQFQWDDEVGQYFFTLRDGPGVTRTFWFPPRFGNSKRSEEWIRPLYSSLGSPVTVEQMKRPASKKYRAIRFLTQDEVLLLDEPGGKQAVMRSLIEDYPEIPPLILKEQLEAVLKRINKA